MIETNIDPSGKLVTVVAEGDLTADDYEKLTPKLEALIRDHDKLNLLFDMSGAGVEPGAAWQDLKFDVQHLTDFGRVALIGDSGWQEAFTRLGNPFTSAEVKYFDVVDRGEATDWVMGSESPR